MAIDDISHLPEEYESYKDQPISMDSYDDGAYGRYLDELNITEQQKLELMSIVWNIMRMWVEMDLPLDNCGQIIFSMIDTAPTDPDAVK